MFFVIPFGILIVLIAATVWIISRKFVYLKKLTPEVVESVTLEQESFLVEFFPGLAAYFQKINWKQYRLDVLAEFEKFLRRLRLFSLKLDTVTNRMIHRVRKSVVHHEGMLNGEAAARAEQEIRVSNGVNGSSKAKDWKEEEQKLILEIAKNPKDPALYKKLGNIYLKTEEWRDAAESFKKVIELDPGDNAVRAKMEKLERKLAKNRPA